MADALSLSMGGRVASIYKQNTKRRRYTTVVNEIEGKRLGFIKKQIEYDRVIESNKFWVKIFVGSSEIPLDIFGETTETRDDYACTVHNKHTMFININSFIGITSEWVDLK